MRLSFLFAAVLADAVDAQVAVRRLQSGTPGTSRLNIHIPHSLFRAEGYNHRDALFGIPAYGGSITQNVYYSQSKLCNATTIDTSTGVPAREVDPKTGKMKPWPSPYILMVDRGDCTFVQKVRNAQRTGAAAVVIADSVCLCLDQECMKKSGTTTCEPEEPIMADDGSGSDISIPSFLMFKHDADLVKDELTANRPVQLEMAWSLPSPDDRVEYDLWTTPLNRVSKDFLRTFGDVAEALGDRAYFTPHMYIYDGKAAGCDTDVGESVCGNLCTNGGRYCAPDPDGDFDAGISGAEVVRESLRRDCIWNKYGAANGIGTEWWKYGAEFEVRCSDPQYFADVACIKDAYKHANVDGDAIKRCIEDSGGTDDPKTNSILEGELLAKEQTGATIIPSAYVNSAVIRGAFNAQNIFSAICSGYVEGTTPQACKSCAGSADFISCVKKNQVNGGREGGLSWGFFFLSMLAVVAVFVAVGAYQQKKTRDEMRHQVRGILAEYMPLDDKDGGDGGVML